MILEPVLLVVDHTNEQTLFDKILQNLPGISVTGNGLAERR